MKKTIEKKKYVAPMVESCVNYDEPLMIDIGSGNTTPEESDANIFSFEEEVEYESHSINLWDDDL